jgi:hypothetical protein
MIKASRRIQEPSQDGELRGRRTGRSGTPVAELPGSGQLRYVGQRTPFDASSFGLVGRFPDLDRVRGHDRGEPHVAGSPTREGTAARDARCAARPEPPRQRARPRPTRCGRRLDGRGRATARGYSSRSAPRANSASRPSSRATALVAPPGFHGRPQRQRPGDDRPHHHAVGNVERLTGELQRRVDITRDDLRRGQVEREQRTPLGVSRSPSGQRAESPASVLLDPPGRRVARPNLPDRLLLVNRRSESGRRPGRVPGSAKSLHADGPAFYRERLLTGPQNRRAGGLAGKRTRSGRRRGRRSA